MERAYIKLPFIILDDFRVASLSDHKWKQYILGLFEDPDNVHYEREVHPVRYEYIRNWEEIRKSVFSRDANKCCKCGSKKNLEVDHIKPISLGGTNDLENLQILCRKCNRTKGNRHGE